MTGPIPSDRGDSRRFLLVFILALLSVNLFIFLPSMSGDYLWDDKYFISENPSILGSRFLSDFWRSPFGGFSGTDDNSVRIDRERQFYRPLTSLSCWLDFKVWGLNPAAFHLTNILLQALNSILLLFILLQIGLGPAASFSGALLFSVFPLHFENVAWISGRTDLLSFFFGAVSTIFFLRYLEKKSAVFLGFSGLFFLAGLLSKETVLFLPAAFLFAVSRENAKTKDILFCCAVFLMSGLVWFTLRRIAFGTASLNLSTRPLTDLIATVGFYTARMVYPFNLSVTIDPAPVFGNWAYIVLGGLVIVLFFISVFKILNRKGAMKNPSFAFFVFVLLLLPSVAVILSSPSISLLAWRFMYFPSAVFITGLAFLLSRQVRPRTLGWILIGMLTIGYVSEVYPKSRLFGQDETAFWLGIQKVEREDLIARFNIGIKTLPRDEKRALEIFGQILAQKEHPLYPMWKTRIYEELAMYYAFQRDFSRAQQYFDGLSGQPGGMSLRSTLNYAYYMAFAGRSDEGEKIIQDIVGRYPRNHYVLIQAARFYLIVKDYSKAAGLFEKDYSLFRNEQTKKFLEELRPLLDKMDH